MARGDTVYSAKIKGARGNFKLPVRFDMTDGFLGIQQFEGADIMERVLLSPGQVKELQKFLSANPAKRGEK